MAPSAAAGADKIASERIQALVLCECVAATQLKMETFDGCRADSVCSKERQLPYLIGRVMSEGSLYAPDLAALALAQTSGDLHEAVLLLRTYRSTQPCLGYTQPILVDQTLTERCIYAAFKDIPGR